MASPHAAGCASLLIQSGEAITPDAIETRLETSPFTVTVPRNGLSFPRIDCRAAALLQPFGDLIPKSTTNTVRMNLAVGAANVGFAIYSDPSFDATTIDPASVRVGTTGLARERDGSYNIWFTDLNRDGLVDAFLFFSRKELFANGDLTPQSSTFTVSGNIGPFKLFSASDFVNVVP
jgi:hypothetical protein